MNEMIETLGLAPVRWSAWLGGNVIKPAVKPFKKLLACFGSGLPHKIINTPLKIAAISKAMQYGCCLAILIPYSAKVSGTGLSEKWAKPEYSLLQSWKAGSMEGGNIGTALKLASKLGNGNKEMVFGLPAALPHEERDTESAGNNRPNHKPDGFIKRTLTGLLYLGSICLGVFIGVQVMNWWISTQYGYVPPNDPSSPTPDRKP